MTAETDIARNFAEELIARSGSDLSAGEDRVIRQAAAGAAHLLIVRAMLERHPEDEAALATHSRLTANLLAGVGRLTEIVGDLHGTTFASVLGGRPA